MIKLTPRSITRQLAVQGIYCYKMNACSILEIDRYLQYLIPAIYDKADIEFLNFLLDHSIKQFDLMLNLYKEFCERDIYSINIIEQIILVIAAIEIIESSNIQSKIIINESINLAKIFTSDMSYKFINTLTDKLSKKIRKESEY